MIAILFAHVVIIVKRSFKDQEKKTKDKLDRFNVLYGFDKDKNEQISDLDVRLPRFSNA